MRRGDGRNCFSNKNISGKLNNKIAVFADVSSSVDAPPAEASLTAFNPC
jgi:hypothetical protein